MKSTVGHGTMRMRLCLAGMVALFNCCGAWAQTPAEPVQRFNIAAQPLSKALLEFAKQSGLIVTVPPALVEGKSAPEVHGLLSPAQALEKLLAGSGLKAFHAPSGGITIGTPTTMDRLAPPQSTSALSDELVEIIVTAQKREERLQEVPVSVSVLSSKQMLEWHETRLIDYAATIPGLSVESMGPGQSTLTLRGLALQGDGATVGTYIDEVPVGPSASGLGARNMALELLPYDLEGIEVLRGPQGTFYGANALGGLIKYVTKAPDLHEFQLSAGGDVFDIDGAGNAGYALRVGGSAPLIDGTLALRASYARESTPGYLDIPSLNADNVNKALQQTGSIALLWEPSDQLSLKLAGFLERTDASDNELIRLNLNTGQPLVGDLKTISALAQPFETTLQLYSVTLKYDLGWSKFTSASSFQNAITQGTTDATTIYGPVVALLTGGAVAEPRVPLQSHEVFRKYTQEFRLATPGGGRFEGMLGAFYTYEDAPVASQSIDALDATGTPIPGLNPLVTAATPTIYMEKAIFANGTYKFSDQFDITAGIRLARNDERLESIVSGPIFPSDDSIAHSAESVFNYSVAPRFHINEDAMVYLRVATGYRPGGPNTVFNPDAGIPNQFKSDRIVNYEAGFKSWLLNRRVLLDVSAFQINWKDVQIGLVDFTTQTGYFANGKAARSRGVEWESAYLVTPGLRLGLVATWVDAVLTEALPENSTIVGPAGARLPGAPRISGAITANYTVPLSEKWSAVAGGIYRYSGSHYSGLSTDPNTLRLSSYSTVDLNAGVTSNAWSVNLFARNVANKRAYIQENLSTDLATNQPLAISGALLQPRTIGLSIDKRF
jgi:iron complex outermembrane recepter protein